MAENEKNLRALAEESAILFHESAQYQPLPDVQAVLAEARDLALQLRRRLTPVGRQYVVALAGLTNVGKSTLVNAIVGDEVSPRLNGPCTSVAIEFSSGRKYAVAVRADSILSERFACETPERLRQILEQMASARGGGADPHVRLLQAEIPGFPENLVLADTPGFGAARESADGAIHEAALWRYIETRASRVFWVVLAEQGIGKTEAQVYEKRLMEKCGDVVITGSEDWDEPDRRRFQHRFSGVLRQATLRFHFASGLQGWQARQAGDAAALDSSGIPTLLAELRRQTDVTSRCQDSADLIRRIGEGLAEWWQEFSGGNARAAANGLWRKDSFYRWLAASRAAAAGSETAALLNKCFRQCSRNETGKEDSCPQ